MKRYIEYYKTFQNYFDIDKLNEVYKDILRKHTINHTDKYIELYNILKRLSRNQSLKIYCNINGAPHNCFELLADQMLARHILKYNSYELPWDIDKTLHEEVFAEYFPECQ